jgi:ribosomal protein S18 acetylase RimI-like enzyme
LKSGIVLIAKDKGAIIGFASEYEFEDDSAITEVLSIEGLNPTDCFYIAELGVNEEYRRKGIGRILMEELLLLTPDQKTPFLRTNKDNYPAQKLYNQLGFYTIPNFSDMVLRKRVDGTIVEDERIYMIKPFIKIYE